MAMPHDHFRKVLADTGNRIAAIRAIRVQFGLTPREAKEVMLQAEQIASNLSEYQGRFTDAAEQILDETARAEGTENA